MTKPETPPLDPDVLQALAVNSPAVQPDADTVARIREQLFQRVHAPAGDYLFVHSHEGKWIRLLKGVELKVLRQDRDSRSYLLRLAAGARIPAHAHGLDEESLVLEGDATINGVLCRSGDYHFAPQGKPHGTISSQAGCLLFVRGAPDNRAAR
jgi:anti-sigma factor ChrR (cupin superfamily)